MTKKEIITLADYSESDEGRPESWRLAESVRIGERTVESLDDRDFVVCACAMWHDFATVMRYGKENEREEAFKLARQAISTGKGFGAVAEVNEGVFENQEEARMYAAQVRFQMWLF